MFELAELRGCELQRILELFNETQMCYNFLLKLIPLLIDATLLSEYVHMPQCLVGLLCA